MSIIVEDGTGMVDSESYVSVGEIDTYMSTRGVTAWATLITSEKEQALRRAMDWLLQKYRARWKGARTSLTQALDWPRAGVFIDTDTDIAYVTWTLNQVPNNVIPSEVKKACMELSLRASIGTLSEDQSQKIIQETAGPVTTKYSEFSSSIVQYNQVAGYLSPFVKANTGGAMLKLGRT